jgi:hypothetical protein
MLRLTLSGGDTISSSSFHRYFLEAARFAGGAWMPRGSLYVVDVSDGVAAVVATAPFSCISSF